MESLLIPARIKDAIRISQTSNFPKFVGFLRMEEAALAKQVAEKEGVAYCFYGGYDSAERVYFGAVPDWCEEKESFFPITALTLNFRSIDTLSHRHILGSLMSLGITRESVGDILTEKGRAVVFLNSEIAPFVTEQLTKVSKVGVTIKKGFTLPLPGMSGFETITETIASERLDCIVSALLKTSRAKGAQFILEKLVSVNSVCVDKPIKTIRSGDTVTIKGKGKFIIESLCGRTKKDRVILIAKKYI